VLSEVLKSRVIRRPGACYRAGCAIRQKKGGVGL